MAALEAGLDHGGASIDDYLDARGGAARCRTSSWCTPARASHACPASDTAEPPPVIMRIVVGPALDLLLPRLPGAAAAATAEDAEAPDRKGEERVTDPPPLPEGFAVGHWSDLAGGTGCTVVIPPPGLRGGVCVHGGGPGPGRPTRWGRCRTPPEANAILITGGSAFGLAAADGVVRWLEQHERGYFTPFGRVPLVPARGDLRPRAGEGKVRPGPEAGYAACEAAAGGVPERGGVGAGTGATVAKVLGRERAVPGGLGLRRHDHGDGRHRRRHRGGERDGRRDRRGRLSAGGTAVRRRGGAKLRA